ncbi:hypothetical protein BDZ94DRAFT_982984 [Collybia nuda]|uniref:Uncharacterized protein n=1 Tax=Collybia nuda TaxID=64659 RepID=A0A9P5Y1Z6_9AGAR|nr:hypothetical protein BDZ94DRAFT_982984 [Collybia nuda]
MSFASWYQHHYSTWNRTRRIQQAPYVARTDSNITRAATAMRGADNAALQMVQATIKTKRRKTRYSAQTSVFMAVLNFYSSSSTKLTLLLRCISGGKVIHMFLISLAFGFVV